MRILVLYWENNPDRCRLTVRQHLYALQVYTEKHQIIYWNACLGIPAWFRWMPGTDVVILHTTLLCMRWGDPAEFRELKERMAWLSTLDVVKIAVPQDEYDHAEILDEWLYNLGISVVFSNFGDESRQLLYPRSIETAAFLQCFTGYIDQNTAEALRPRLRPLKNRALDIVYRARRLPYWFGSHGQMKHEISDVVGEAARRRGLVVDMSTKDEDAVLGEQWLGFLSSSRAVLGCESGSSVLDARGMVREEIRRAMQANPVLTFDEVSRRMPVGWDSYEFFAISPRHFEAVMTKTGQVLLEGRYNGVLQAWRHYIPLKRDFSNLDQVLDVVRDTDRLQQMVDRTYEEIVERGRYTYRQFAETIEVTAESVLAKRAGSDRDSRHGKRIFFSVAWSVAQRLTLWQESTYPAFQRVRRLVRRIGTPAQRLRFTVRMVVAVSQVWGVGPLRRVVLQLLSETSARRNVGIGALVKDLWRLILLRRAVSGIWMEEARSAFWLDMQFDPVERSLLFRSHPCSPGSPPNPGVLPALRGQDNLARSLKRIVWDHSSVSDSVSYPISRLQVMVPMGPNGLYEFHSLGQLVECAPESGRQCLDWFLCNM
ncbi:MAG: hypothetical protein AB7G68_00730 [Nitrospiraceae bacterium]